MPRFCLFNITALFFSAYPIFQNMFWECQAFIFKVDSSSSNGGPFTKYGVASGKRNKFSFAAILVACSFQQERNNLMFEWFKAYALCFVSLCPTRLTVCVSAITFFSYVGCDEVVLFFWALYSEIRYYYFFYNDQMHFSCMVSKKIPPFNILTILIIYELLRNHTTFLFYCYVFY